MTQPRRLTAKFAGTCRGCGRTIEPGDAIAWYGSRVTYHVACDETTADAAEPSPARWTRPADPDDPDPRFDEGPVGAPRRRPEPASERPWYREETYQDSFGDAADE